MRPGQALIAALGDLYRQSWRLLLLNAAFSATTLPLLVASVWAPIALAPAVLIAGPVTLALMHCAVTLASTEELSVRCGLAGLRLHWRRGVVLGVANGLVLAAGVVALVGYGRSELWPLVAFVGYLLAAYCIFLLALLPLAVVQASTPLRVVLRRALTIVLSQPLQFFVLAVALAIVNLLGAAAALLPLLTLTVAYSFVATAHFMLSRFPPLEANV